MDLRAEIERFLADYQTDRPSVIAVDTETTGVWWRDTAFCMSVAWVEGEVKSYFIDLDALIHDGRYEGVPAGEEVRSILQNCKNLVFHNAKFDAQKLIDAGLMLRANLTPGRLRDTMTMAHLLNEHRSKRLKDLAVEELGIETTEAERIKQLKEELGIPADSGYDRIYYAEHPTARQELIEYAKKDAEYTILLYRKFLAALEKKPKLLAKCEKEWALLLVIIDIEAAGMAVDIAYVEATIKEYALKILDCEGRIEEASGRRVFKDSDLIPRQLPEPVWNKAGTKILRTHETKKAAAERALEETFNPASVPQVTDVFLDLGIMLQSTNREHLEAVDHPLAQLIIELRQYERIRNTYLIAIRDEAVDGILHPNFRTTGTKTGRFSSGKNEG